jgi:hypothetical protein
MSIEFVTCYEEITALCSARIGMSRSWRGIMTRRNFGGRLLSLGCHAVFGHDKEDLGFREEALIPCENYRKENREIAVENPRERSSLFSLFLN